MISTPKTITTSSTRSTCSSCTGGIGKPLRLARRVTFDGCGTIEEEEERSRRGHQKRKESKALRRQWKMAKKEAARAEKEANQAANAQSRKAFGILKAPQWRERLVDIWMNPFDQDEDDQLNDKFRTLMTNVLRAAGARKDDDFRTQLTWFQKNPSSFGALMERPQFGCYLNYLSKKRVFLQSFSFIPVYPSSPSSSVGSDPPAYDSSEDDDDSTCGEVAEAIVSTQPAEEAENAAPRSVTPLFEIESTPLRGTDGGLPRDDAKENQTPRSDPSGIVVDIHTEEGTSPRKKRSALVREEDDEYQPRSKKQRCRAPLEPFGTRADELMGPGRYD